MDYGLWTTCRPSSVFYPLLCFSDSKESPLPVLYGLWTVDYLSSVFYPLLCFSDSKESPLPVLYGLWTMDYGLFPALLSSMDYGLWTMDFFVLVGYSLAASFRFNYSL